MPDQGERRCTCPTDVRPHHQVGTWDCPIHHDPAFLARLAEVIVPRNAHESYEMRSTPEEYRGVMREANQRLHADLLGEVLFQQALQHPLPWRVESDWTEEVRASDGYCIAKCRTQAEAQAIIAVATAKAALDEKEVR
jgi:hypothetical protein